MKYAFSDALAFTLTWEGGLANHPDDPGGVTKYGISQRAYPELDIRNLTSDEAARIYRRDYWDQIRGDELPGAVGFVLFDYAVHSGVERAQRALQLAAGVKDDGVLGPATMAAVAAHPVPALVIEILHLRGEQLVRFSTGRTKAFALGWARRLVSNAFQAGDMLA